MPPPLDAEVQMICQKQDDETHLQRAADQISSQIAGAVEMAVSRAVHPLTMSMDNFIQGTSRDQLDGMQHIVNQFVKQLNGSLNGQFSALADTLAMLNQNQAATHKNLQRTLTIAESLVDDARKVEQSARKASSADMIAHQTELLALLRQTSEQQAETARNLTRVQGEMLKTLQTLESRLNTAEPGRADAMQVPAEMTEGV